MNERGPGPIGIIVMLVTASHAASQWWSEHAPTSQAQTLPRKLLKNPFQVTYSKMDKAIREHKLTL